MIPNASLSEPSALAATLSRIAAWRFAPATEGGAAAGPESAGLPDPIRVLVVEDDYLISMSVEDALTQASVEVVGVSRTAEEAVETAGATRPTLVVMDIRLASKRDGIDAALEIFRRFGIRCIFATAHADAEVQARALAATPLGWLQKPYSTNALVDLVHAAARTVREN